MKKRSKSLVAVCGVLCIMFTFIFVGLAYALSVNQPSGGTLVGGSTAIVQLTFDKTVPPAFQYRLYYCCGTCPAVKSLWTIMTIRGCDYYGTCPSTYYWIVPLVQSTTPNCSIGVEVLDKNFNVLGRRKGGTFTIAPSFGGPSPLTLAPPVVFAVPGGSAQLSVSGGTPPYTISTDNNGVMTAPFPLVVGAPGSGYVANYYTCGVDQTVTITVTDSALPTSATATSTYIIDCP